MPTQLVRQSSDWLAGWLLRGWGRGKGLYPGGVNRLAELARLDFRSAP